MCLAACEYRCNAGVREDLSTFMNNPDCIEQSEVCDGWVSCADGQDEAGCGKCKLSHTCVQHVQATCYTLSIRSITDDSEIVYKRLVLDTSYWYQ
jgi:hypothetical protein